MQYTLRPYVTAGIAIVGASLIAVTPMAAAPSNVQRRAVQLVDYTEYDASQLATATEANWTALEQILNTSNWTTDPDISQGISTLLTDLGQGTANPVTNPFALGIEGVLGVLSSSDAFSAASTAATAVTDNIESAISSGDYSTALTDFENAGTTIIYAFLNGYPDAVGSGNDISPEFALLTNTGTGAATGLLDGFHQISNTIADEISALGGGGLTTSPTVLEPGSLDLSVNLDNLLADLFPGGTISLPPIDTLLADLIPGGTISLPPIDTLLGDLFPGGTLNLPFSLNDLLAGATNGDVTLPSLDSLIGDLAGSSTTLPITPDELIGFFAPTTGSIDLGTLDSLITGLDTSGAIGSISIDDLLTSLGISGLTLSGVENLLGGIGTENITPTLISALESALGTSGSNEISVSASQIVAFIDNSLGASGNQDIPISSLESLLGSAGTSPITIPVTSIEQILGNSGSGDISLPISELETLLGSDGTSPLSIPLSSIDSILGSLGTSDISIPLSTIEGLLPSTLSLDLDIPGITGGAVPNYDVDLAQDLLAALGSITPIANELPALLGTDPTFDATSLISGLLGDLGLPVSLGSGDLTVNLTGLLSEALAGLF